MNDLMNYENPEGYLVKVTLEEAIKRVDNIVTSYKEYKICEAMEATKRTAIRENARVQVIALEEATKRELRSIEGKEKNVDRLVTALENIVMMRDVLDEGTMQVCTKLLETVSKCLGV